jgi:hypothetical protein
MKITKETKLEDIIPEGYELRREYGFTISKVGSCINIPIKPKEKTFEDYTKEFYQEFDPDTSEALFILNTKPEELKMKDKLAFLWYIIEDKKGNLMSLGNLLSMIFHETRYKDFTGTEISIKVYSILPKSFIKSFKQEEDDGTWQAG